MKAADLNFNLIDNYLRLLEKLSPDNKQELIARLSDSLKNKKEPSKSMHDLYGAFISEKTADEIISELKSSRTFRRNTEEL